MNAINIKIGKNFKSNLSGKIVTVSDMQISFDGDGKIDGWVDYQYDEGQISSGNAGVIRTANLDLEWFAVDFCEVE